MFCDEACNKKRQVLVIWVFEVSLRLRHSSATTFIAVSLIDRYLTRVSVAARHLQLVGVTALYIACKFQEIMFTSAGELAHYTNKACTKEDIIRMERRMLRVLNFQVNNPHGYEFLERYWTVSGESRKAFFIAQLCYELGMLEERLIAVPHSIKACAALYIAISFESRKRGGGRGAPPLPPTWSAELETVSGYKAATVHEVAQKMLNAVKDYKDRQRCRGIVRKYSLPEFGAISLRDFIP